jgi:trigger factor
MQSEVENLSGLSKKLKVSIPQEQLKEKVELRLKELAKKANIKGFRKGKVPVSVVKQQYGDSVLHEVVQEFLYDTFPKALEEHGLNPAGRPHIEITNLKEDGPLAYEATFEVYPDVEINYQDITVEKPKTEVTDEQVSEVIEKLRHQNAKWNEEEKTAEEGNLVVIDFEGFIDNEPFEGGKANDFKLELGKGMMIPGFEDPIYGKQPGSNFEANVTFPEDYHEKKYAGKDAKFTLHLKKVMSAELPSLDDAFANDLGVSDGTIAGLNNEVRQNLERELERRIRDRVRAQIIEKIIEKNIVEVPQSSIDQEVERLDEMFKKQLSTQGVKNPPEMPKETFQEQARKNVVLGLLLSQWIKQNNIKVDADRVRDRVEQIASGYHHPDEIVNWYYANEEALKEIEASVLEDQAIDKLLEVINVTEKEIPFEELMNVGSQKR